MGHTVQIVIIKGRLNLHIQWISLVGNTSDQELVNSTIRYYNWYYSPISNFLLKLTYLHLNSENTGYDMHLLMCHMMICTYWCITIFNFMSFGKIQNVLCLCGYSVMDHFVYHCYLTQVYTIIILARIIESNACLCFRN